MALREVMAIEIGRRRLRALLASRERGSVVIKRVLVEDVPADLATGDADALGAWIGERLTAAKFPLGRTTVALAREHVGLKRLTLPSIDDNELPEMTRLALRRELPFDAEKAVIDFVPVERTDSHTTVMAVAVPEDVLETTRAVVKAAGLGIERIALRATGSAALLKRLVREGGASVLAVDVTGDGVEFCVVENGSIRFSRAAGVGSGHATDEAPADAETVADTIVTETRRTWMSYRIVEDAADVGHVTVMGDADVTQLAAPLIGEMLSAEAHVIDHHPMVSSNGASMDLVWPLAGLLLEGQRDETIDFARPRQTVDRGAVRRRRLVMAAGLAAVALFGAWTVGRHRIATMESQLEKLTDQRGRRLPDVARVQRDDARLAHLRRWESADVRWLEHVELLRGMLPPSDELVLDGWTGSVDFRGVRCDKKTKKWSAPKEVTIVLEGEARDRRDADALRQVLVENDWYTANSAGTDTAGGKRLPFGFTFRLSTAHGETPGDSSPVDPDATKSTPVGASADRRRAEGDGT